MMLASKREKPYSLGTSEHCLPPSGGSYARHVNCRRAWKSREPMAFLDISVSQDGFQWEIDCTSTMFGWIILKSKARMYQFIRKTIIILVINNYFQINHTTKSGASDSGLSLFRYTKLSAPHSHMKGGICLCRQGLSPSLLHAAYLLPMLTITHHEKLPIF